MTSILSVIRANLGITVFVISVVSSLIGGIVSATITITNMHNADIQTDTAIKSIQSDVASIHGDVRSVDGRLNTLHEDQAVTKAQIDFIYDRIRANLVTPVPAPIQPNVSR